MDAYGMLGIKDGEFVLKDVISVSKEPDLSRSRGLLDQQCR
jgi:hypothetical protein